MFEEFPRSESRKAIQVLIMNVKTARTMVKAMLPLRLAPFKIGINPKMLFNQIKKNTVNK